MASKSLYRKYRPQTFSDVVGQEHIEQTLRNALANDMVSHAYLFCGPRGTGKTTTARLLAKALLCEHAPTANPCGVCCNCTDIAESAHPDVYEIDAASRTGVDNVREEIIGKVAFSPTRGRYKVYIIDEVHMLSPSAFNALLKTFEEPPAHVVFVMCTTEPHKVPDTIMSRCQRFDFHSLATEQICTCLEHICEGEGFSYDQDGIELIAEQAKGGMRDAITALEQVAVFGNGNVTFDAAQNMFGDVDVQRLTQVVDCIARRDMAGCFSWVEELSRTGIDVEQIARDLTSYVRDIYVAAVAGRSSALAPMSAEALATLERQAAELGSPDRVASMILVLGDLLRELRGSSDARLSLEIALTRMAHPRVELTLESLSARIDALEVGGVAYAPMAAPVATESVAPAPAVEPAVAYAAPEPAAAATLATESVEEPAAPAAASALMPDSNPTPASDTETPSGGGHAASFLKDPGSLRRLWDNAVRSVGENHPMIPGLMGGARPHANLREMKITVELPQDADFALSTLSMPDSMQWMREALKRSFGTDVQLEYKLGGVPGQASTGQTSAQPSDGQSFGQAAAQPSAQTEGGYGGSGGAPSDYAPSDYTPADFSPADYAPADYSPADYASADHAPAAGIPEEPQQAAQTHRPSMESMVAAAHMAERTESEELPTAPSPPSKQPVSGDTELAEMLGDVFADGVVYRDPNR